MKTPVAPVSSAMVDKSGMLTSSWQQYFTNLTSGLQYTLPDDGVIVPTVTAAQIASMEQQFISDGDLNPKYNQPRLVKNSDTGNYMLNVSGIFKNIQVI